MREHCLRVPVGDNSVEHELVQVGRLEPQHLVDARAANLVSSLPYILGGSLEAPKGGADEVLAVLVEQVKGVAVSARRNLDELREAIADLGNGEGAEESKVKEGVRRSVVSAEAVLVLAVVDGHLDGDGGINQTYNGGGNTDVVCVAPVGGTREAKREHLGQLSSPDGLHGGGGEAYPATSVTRPPPTTSTGSFLYTPKSVMVSTMPRRVSMLLAFSPIMVLWTRSSMPWWSK